jgi:hypothetical protein
MGIDHGLGRAIYELAALTNPEKSWEFVSFNVMSMTFSYLGCLTFSHPKVEHDSLKFG